MANNVAEDRIRRGTLLDVQGATAVPASYDEGPQFIGGAAAEWSFWITIELGAATSVSLKLENTYDGSAWAVVASFRNDIATEDGEHTFSADGTYLVTTKQTVRAFDKTSADAFGNVGGLRWSVKGSGSDASTRVVIKGACW